MTFEALPGYSDPVVIEVTNRALWAGPVVPAGSGRGDLRHADAPPQNGASSAAGAPRAAWQAAGGSPWSRPPGLGPRRAKSGAGLAAVPAPGLTAPRVRFVLILEVARP